MLRSTTPVSYTHLDVYKRQSLSRSEIVVPILANGQVKGVLDIDSNLLNFFDETDRRYLEEVTAIVCLLYTSTNWTLVAFLNDHTKQTS